MGIKFYLSYSSKERPVYFFNKMRETTDDDVFISMTVSLDSGVLEKTGTLCLAPDIVEYVNNLIKPSKSTRQRYALYTEDQFFEHFGHWLPF